MQRKDCAMTGLDLLFIVVKVVQTGVGSGNGILEDPMKLLVGRETWTPVIGDCQRGQGVALEDGPKVLHTLTKTFGGTVAG